MEEKTQLGPHLLGRKPNVPDERDWTPDKLHAHLDALAATQDTSILDKTIRQAVSENNPFVTTWKGILALWKLIKTILFHPVPPTPPTPVIDGPLWDDPIVLDQGNYGTCVGNAWAGWGNSAPIQDHYTEADARKIYYEATCIGGACDSTYQNGSTTRDGAKAMQKRSKLLAYAFAASISDVEEWLENHGPVVIGINWSNSMFSPDADGTVHYNPTDIAGGHEVVVLQNVRSQGKKRVRNSWGDAWGISGNFFITDSDFVKLLTDGGDACLAAEV